MSYSQTDEEPRILEFFGDSVGRFLDIGAHNGITFSNTRALFERGWSGVVVEASPESAIKLKELYSGTRVQVVQALVGKQYRLREFFDTPDLVSTMDLDHMNKWKGLAQYKSITLPEVPLPEIVKAFPGPYDFISIDIEGLPTLDAFMCLSQMKFLGSKLVCVEHDFQQEILSVGGLRVLHRSRENLLMEPIG